MEPIATYCERRIDGRRQYSLFPQEILVVGNRLLGANFEARIPLKSLEPSITRLFVRSTFFLAGVILALGCTFICVNLWWLKVPLLSFWPDWIFIVSGIGGFILAAWTFKRVEFTRFRTSAGVAMLDIAQTGRERHKYDEFVNTLIEQIKSTKAS